MKSPIVLASAVLATSAAFAADHGPVFSYATPVNSQRELSFDTGIFGRNGSHGTQFSTGSGVGYDVTLTSLSTHSSQLPLAVAIYQRAAS